MAGNARHGPLSCLDRLDEITADIRAVPLWLPSTTTPICDYKIRCAVVLPLPGKHAYSQSSIFHT